MKWTAFIFAAVVGVLLSGLPRAQEVQYTLGSGDQLRITVFGEKDLSGEFFVDGTGFLSLPLIGEVRVGGLTLRQVEQEIVNKFLDGFLKQPQVSIDVLNYRPFYILGEVKEPGSYAYVAGMRVLTAVAIGGGFTYRADKGDIVITRATDPEQKERKAKLDTQILPGDIIHVEERFF